MLWPDHPSRFKVAEPKQKLTSRLLAFGDKALGPRCDSHILARANAVSHRAVLAAVRKSAFGTKLTNRAFSCLSAFAGKADMAW